ncbi:heterokaryon incompatibility protein-domain-containing protein [Tricladium varicosporioides]|nr:heterokaryon incompatibility protein-domain-containing protein [Hymenoscyphus varicosporioides]
MTNMALPNALLDSTEHTCAFLDRNPTQNDTRDADDIPGWTSSRMFFAHIIPTDSDPLALYSPPERIPPPTCKICQDLDFRAPGYSLPSQLLINFDDFCRSVEAGCPSCNMLHKGILAWIDPISAIKAIRLSSERVNAPLNVFVLHKTDPGRTQFLEFYTLPGKPTSWPAVGQARHISVDSSSDDSIAMASRWLSECTEKHKNCHFPPSTTLPTRVIEVGEKGTNPRLHETNSATGRYAALSHCWGTERILTTTISNLTELKKEIAFESLPKTFQDAIDIARRLNIPYLWIDSLCIIQDSPEDWKREAALMGGIYAHSLVTIAADGAPDGRTGCFVAGESRMSKQVQIQCHDHKNRTFETYVRPHGWRAHPDDSSHTTGPKDDSQIRSKLSTRGWVLQERLLSPRTLHFTKNEMAWECVTHVCCECQVNPQKSTKNVFKQLFVKEGSSYNGKGIIELKWYDVVEEFTSRDLTFETDRLPAIAGLAAELQKCVSYNYLAGLWDDFLEMDLLWSTSTWNKAQMKSFICKRIGNHYAPTWSWASVTGLIKYRIRAELHSADTNFQLMLGDPPSMSMMTAGPYSKDSIRKRGYVVPVRVKAIDIPSHEVTNRNVLWAYGPERNNKKHFMMISERDNSNFYYRGSAFNTYDRTTPSYKFINFANAEEEEDTTESEDLSRPRKQNFGILDQTKMLVDGEFRMPGMCPYEDMDPDVKSGDYELDETEEYLFLLVMVEVKGGVEKSVHGLVLKRAENGIADNWERVGIVSSRYHFFREWFQVASPYCLTLV